MLCTSLWTSSKLVICMVCIFLFFVFLCPRTQAGEHVIVELKRPILFFGEVFFIYNGLWGLTLPFVRVYGLISQRSLKPPLARFIQNGFTGKAKAGEARKNGFFRLLVYFNPVLQNGFTLQCLHLRKIDEDEAGISRAKEALIITVGELAEGDWQLLV